jgi:hypothetical protein
MRRRWIRRLGGVVVVAVLGLGGCGKARSLGKHCHNSDDCGWLSCGWEVNKAAKLSDVGDVCTMACKSSEDCKEELGDSYCNEHGLCVRECRQDADCPANTYCINHNHCGR